LHHLFQGQMMLCVQTMYQFCKKFPVGVISIPGLG
jgi:hypothetical protein